MHHVLEIETARTLPDTRRAKAGTRTVGSASVEGGAYQQLSTKCSKHVTKIGLTNESDIVLDVVVGKAGMVLHSPEGRDAREDRVGLEHAISRART